jgi:Flp pilus assembly protein TadG
MTVRVVTRRPDRRVGRGQALAEFAVAIPIFLVVMMALIEGGAFAFTLTTLESVTQRGGRMAALPSTTSESTVQSFVVAQAAAAGVTVAASNVVVTCTPSCTLSTKDTKDRVRIVVSYTYTPLTAVALGGSATFPLQAVTEYHAE